MSPTNILSLAVELLQEIISFLSPQHAIDCSNTSFLRTNLHTLRLVCRLFKFVVDPLVFSAVGIDFRHTRAILQHQISTLVGGTSSPSLHCRQLQIQGRPPVYDPDNPKYDIITAIKSLRNMRIVIWNVENANMTEPIIQGLNQLPQLEELCLRLQSPLSYEPGDSRISLLDRSCHRYLRRISLIHVSERNFTEDITQQLCKIIKQNPLLTHLDLEFRIGETRLGNCTFSTFVRDIPEESPLPLRYLRLCGHSLGFDNSTLPHLKFLSSIDISSTLFANYDHLWLVLGTAPTWLNEISVDKISQNLLNYLTLYSGLTKFCFIDTYEQECRERDRNRFFSVVLPKHRNSLSTLAIATASPDVWCITPAYMTLILVLQNIKSLTITLAYADILSADFGGISTLENMVMMAFHLPRLQVLRFDFSRSDGMFACRRDAYYHYAWTTERAAEKILSVDISKLGRSWDCFQLQTPGGNFVISDSDGCMRWIKKSSRCGLAESY